LKLKKDMVWKKSAFHIGKCCCFGFFWKQKLKE
jgi:hypothetical protein